MAGQATSSSAWVQDQDSLAAAALVVAGALAASADLPAGQECSGIADSLAESMPRSPYAVATPVIGSHAAKQQQVPAHEHIAGISVGSFKLKGVAEEQELVEVK